MAEETIAFKKSTVQLVAVFVVALVVGYFLGAYTSGGRFLPQAGTSGNPPSPGSNGGGSSGGSATAQFKEYAKSLGLNEAQFNSCLDGDKYRDEVLKDFQDGVNVGVGGTPTFFINGQEISGAQPFSVFKQAIDAELAKSNATADKTLVDDDPAMGDQNAKVVVVEFSDFQCPFCGRFFAQTLPQVENEYIKTGKVLFVYRDFPLSSIHPNAQKAAEAAECADEQGKWRGMHDLIFQNQDTWAGMAP